MIPSTKNAPSGPAGAEPYRFLYLTDLLDYPVYAGPEHRKLGKLTDLVFALREPYPELVGLYLEHGWGKPTEFIPYERVERLEQRRAVHVKAPEGSGVYPPF